MIGPLPEDVAQANMLEQGSALLLRAIHDHFDRRAHGLPLRPFPGTRFRWNGHEGTAQRDPNSKSMAITVECAERYRAHRELAEQLRTRRDPCFRCGTRGDHGCKHGGGE